MSMRDIHTYIIGHYNPSVKIIDLVSHMRDMDNANPHYYYYIEHLNLQQ